MREGEGRTKNYGKSEMYLLSGAWRALNTMLKCIKQCVYISGSEKGAPDAALKWPGISPSPSLLACTYHGNLFQSEFREYPLDVAVDILFFHEEVPINYIFSVRGIKERGSWEIRQIILMH